MAQDGQGTGAPEDLQAAGASTEERMGPRAWLAAIPLVPLPVLGLGVYRAWLNVLYARSALGGTDGLFVSQSVFDLVMVAALLLCAFGARHLTPLYPHRGLRLACGALLVCATFCGYGAAWSGGASEALLWLCTLLGGVGTAFIILLWSELYGALAPVRICLYYAASLVAGAALSWVYEGFKDPWLPVMTALLPVASLMCLRSCYRAGLAEPPRDTGWAQFSFPWKPVLVIAACTFAYGLLQSEIAGVSRPNASAGTVLLAALVVAAITLGHRHVDFGLVHGTLLPFAAAALLLLAAVPEWGPWARNLLANAGYAANQIFIMTVVGSICYRWGASAVWLFGIERAVRSLAMMAGRTVDGWLAGSGAAAIALLVIVVMAATLVALREGRLDSAWGVELSKAQKDPGRSEGVERRHALARACADLTREHGLSQREEEVLLLLAQHKTARDIERELCVANGTAKAHIRHVYQKLGIHTREELFALVEAGCETARRS